MKTLLIILLRLFAALISISWHVPDEIWQSSEIAHSVVFGYGYKTWEWRSDAQIRSFLHPSLFLPWFYLLKALQISDPYWFIIGPRLIQGLLSCFGDIFLIKAVELLYRKEPLQAKQCFYWIYFGNCFMNFCASRPLINTMECALSNIALYLYLIKDTFSLVAILSIGFIARPTLILFWLPMALFYLWDLSRDRYNVMSHLVCAGCVAISVFLSSFIFDSFMYGNWTFPPWNFFKWNILSGVGSFYGTHPYHWYLSNASLALWNLACIPIFLSLYRCYNARKLRPLLISAIVAVIGFSFIGHKEHRFILPLLSILMIFGGIGLSQWKWKNYFISIYVPLNLLAFVYLSTTHQSGSTKVVYPYLSRELALPSNSTVMFLMPCHSTPHQSYLHRPDVNLRFLTCEPSGMTDEAEEFYSNPHKWLMENNGRLNAETVIFFDNLQEELDTYMANFGYEVRNQIFHTHFPVGRIGKEILVYHKRNSN